MTPQQAAEHARQWEARAATARSEQERAAALASARGWWQEHHRLSARAGRAPWAAPPQQAYHPQSGARPAPHAWQGRPPAGSPYRGHAHLAQGYPGYASGAVAQRRGGPAAPWPRSSWLPWRWSPS
ncbi:hypothetical protein GCM10025875_08730 [Litorihabitans aurantiacus]|uniref:Uncharacterized protein n=1 Tax=Litorihabitans aurantiacus TaxID=1930061 RepID=A0AA37UPV2_9MICO|nr:hypothetical protein GCM10025875_08730 [Litorihabitans aurantiacus]